MVLEEEEEQEDEELSSIGCIRAIWLEAHWVKVWRTVICFLTVSDL